MPLPTNKPSNDDEGLQPSVGGFERPSTPGLSAAPPKLNPRFNIGASDEDELEESDLEEELPQALDTEAILEEAPPVAPRAPATFSTPAAAPVPTREFSEDNVAAMDEAEDAFEDSHTDYEEAKRREIIANLSDSAKENAKKLLQRIADDESSEVLLNGPNEIMFKVNGQRFYDRNISFEDIETYHTVINSLILYETDTTDRIGKSSYLIEGQLELPDYDNPNNPPLFARVHVLAPPVVKAAKVTIAKKAKNQFGIDDIQAKGAMSPQMAAFLKALSRGRATVVLSGLSGSGKTTLLEAMSHHFDENDRAVVVEDTSELRLPLPDAVYLLSTSRKPGQDTSEIVTLEWLVAQANRMRPDRIIVGEIRGGEIAEFLSAANSGADGSMTTVHASSPRQTLDKMLSLAMKSATAKNEQSVLRDISSTVQIIVQTALVDGRHVISHIEEVSNTVLASGNGIATTPLFQFDRNTGAFGAVGRPSDALSQFLGQRGVRIDPSWFARGF